MNRETKQLARAWRKSSIAARILRREAAGTLLARDIRIGKILGDDPAVSSRLIQQALKGYEFRDLRLANSRRQVASKIGQSTSG